MNDRNRHIEKQVRQTMSLLDHPEKIQAGPWFRSHVHNKLRQLHEKPEPQTWVWQRLLRPSVLVIIVILNVATFLTTINTTQASQDTRETYLNTLASEYQLSVSNEFYDTIASAVAGQ